MLRANFHYAYRFFRDRYILLPVHVISPLVSSLLYSQWPHLQLNIGVLVALACKFLYQLWGSGVHFKYGLRLNVIVLDWGYVLWQSRVGSEAILPCPPLEASNSLYQPWVIDEEKVGRIIIWRCSSSWWLKTSKALPMLKAAWDLGINTIDTVSTAVNYLLCQISDKCN